jgi:hypothetical protein
MTRSSMVAWKMPTFFNVWRLTVVHSYSKKMLESGDNQIKKKGWWSLNQSTAASLKTQNMGRHEL